MPPKRKAKSSADHARVQKRTNTRSVLAMESFLKTLSYPSERKTSDGEAAPDMSADTSVVVGATTVGYSPLLVQAMTRCHERFLRVVAAELAAGADVNSTKVNRVGVSHVQRAMRELGMSDIVQEAMRNAPTLGETSQTESEAPRKQKSKHAMRSKQWSKEEIAEQERLLASSMNKLRQAGG